MVDGPTIHTGFRPRAAGISRTPERGRLRTLREAARLVPGPAYHSKPLHPAIRQELGGRESTAFARRTCSAGLPILRPGAACSTGLLALAPNLPARLLPSVLELFGVWQNVFTEISNRRSSNILDLCSSWLIDLEGSEYSRRFSLNQGKWSDLGGMAPSSPRNLASYHHFAVGPSLPRTCLRRSLRASHCERPDAKRDVQRSHALHTYDGGYRP